MAGRAAFGQAGEEADAVVADPGQDAVVDLLEAFSTPGERWDTYFFACDYHWNEAGNAAAARYLSQRLGGFYEDLR